MATSPVFRTYGDREVRLTNLDKVLFPDDGIRKSDLIDHVVACAEPLLAALRDRPLSMERRPDGLAGAGFFHKHAPEHFPEWIRRVETPTSRGPMVQAVIDDLPSLVHVTNFGCLTPHVPVTTVAHPDHPDQMVFDLDPSVEDDGAMREAGHLVREVLAERGLPGFARWSGSRGLHVVVPLDRSADHAAVNEVAEQVARDLEERHPERFTTAFKKALRGDRIYLDLARNHPGATVVASWAVRARPGAPVAMPIGWDELSSTGPRSFGLRTARERLALRPWATFDAERVDVRTGLRDGETDRAP